MELEIQTMQPGERLYAYRQSTQLEGQTGGIGRLRGDFGRNGREFFTTWEDGHGRYKTDAFRQEFDRVVNTLRQPGGLFGGRNGGGGEKLVEKGGAFLFAVGGPLPVPVPALAPPRFACRTRRTKELGL